jgi:hypothetical protein
MSIEMSKVYGYMILIGKPGIWCTQIFVRVWWYGEEEEEEEEEKKKKTGI